MSSAQHGPLEIKSLAFGGSGIARHEGRVIFVRGAVPGDLVHVRLLREKKRYAEAEIVRIERPSSERCAARCKVFGDCGGCQWQMLSYSAQLRHKEQIFADILRRHAGVEEDRLLPILESPAEWHYRSRVQFKCHAFADGRFVIGFFRAGSHIVVDIDSCPLVDPSINLLLPQVRALLEGSSYVGDIPQLDFEKGDGDAVRLVVHYLGPDEAGLVERLKQLCSARDLSLYLQSGRKSSLRHLSGPAELEIEVDAPALKLAYGAGGFAQVNLAQNRRMVAESLRMARPSKEQVVFDLYCGMGNFSLPFARRSLKVLGVEDFGNSVAQAKKNACRNGLENTGFFARAAQGACRELRPESGFDTILLDPPRSGAREVVAELVEQRVARLLYVSCDPMTLSRDLKQLQLGGYRLLESRPVDMFPQTYHLESLSLLSWEG